MADTTTLQAAAPAAAPATPWAQAAAQMPAPPRKSSWGKALPFIGPVLLFIVWDLVVRLGMVATVEDGFAEIGGFSLRNGHPNVGLSIIRSRESSTVTVAERMHAEVKEINKTLEKGTQLEVTFDGGEDASNSLYNVIHALVFGAGLTIFVVYAFLNSWRSTLITGLSLPTSAITSTSAIRVRGMGVLLGKGARLSTGRSTGTAPSTQMRGMDSTWEKRERARYSGRSAWWVAVRPMNWVDDVDVPPPIGLCAAVLSRRPTLYTNAPRRSSRRGASGERSAPSSSSAACLDGATCGSRRRAGSLTRTAGC